MATSDKYLRSGRELTSIDVRFNGPGWPWYNLDINGAITNPGGGYKSITREYGRTVEGEEYYLGATKGGNPQPKTFQVMARLTAEKIIAGHFKDSGQEPNDKKGQPVTLRMRWREQGSPQTDLANYTSALIFHDCYPTNANFGQNLSDAKEGNDNIIDRNFDIDSAFETPLKKLIHNASVSGTTVGINKIVLSQSTRGVTAWAISDGVSSVAAPQVGYYRPRIDSSWTWVDVNAATNGANLSDIVVRGGRVVVCGPTDDVMYASEKDIIAGATNPFTASSGIATQNVQAMAVDDDNVIWAGGTSGWIWKSTDLGISFSVVDQGAAISADINSVAVATPTRVYFGGATGKLARMMNGAVSEITVTGTPSDTINRVIIPEGRDKELYLATDGGEIYRTVDSDESAPTFTNMSVPWSGGNVLDIGFGGWGGDVMFVLHTDVSSDGLVYRDLSGGACTDFEEIGSRSTPANSGYLTVAPFSANYALVGGAIESAAGYIGIVSAK